MFAHRFLGSPRGKHCNSLEGIAWRKFVPTSNKMILERDYRFFAAPLWIRVMLIQEKSKFLFEKPCIM